ncbi:hypothetical protein Sango_0465600 [Sesamum angolense]|uniref:Tify domain-containing protein n=1 Tax=Sesamum angolense TaxID=2727404 RepID=A0AAE2C4K6_9LAMI|nr:hypothetical protein Sango_0465600 [Sesamum angolense]
MDIKCLWDRVTTMQKAGCVDVPITMPESGIIMCNALPQENSSGFQSVPNEDMVQLFGCGIVGTDGSDVKKEFLMNSLRRIHLSVYQFLMVYRWISHTPRVVKRPSHRWDDPVVRKVKHDIDETYQDVMEALARPVSSYSLLYEQPSVQRFEMPSKKEVDLSIGNAVVSTSAVPKSRLESTYRSKSEKKPARKEAPHSFLTNVKSLLNTGMLDGVSVRYISASREELHGTIKSSGYLCGCQSCNYSEVLNAYEFERHASCKTSHPNNHIHFENGKTIHQIVQELKTTPQNMLIDAIQTLTGSVVNQKASSAWKESFKAVAHKHQNIYAKS